MIKAEETLDAIEKDIRKKSEIFKTAQKAMCDAEEALKESVKNYEALREYLQRDVWRGKGLGWCQEEDKFCPQESIVLLYIERLGWHGEHYSRHQSLDKTVASICQGCAKKFLSTPHGGEEKFQCYMAKKEGDGFVILVSGKWIPIPNPDRTEIRIERKYIPEKEYQFGKHIASSFFPNAELKIGGEEII